VAARLLALLAVGAAAAGLAGCGGSSTDESAAGTPSVVETTSAGIRLVSPADAKGIIDAGGITLLDVRTPDEFAQSHIAGAENIDFYASDFADRIGALDRDERYVVYCHTGNRSGRATALMAELGFTNVSDVDGGIAAWETAQLPTIP